MSEEGVGDSVKVAVRVRPLSQKERDESSVSVVSYHPGEQIQLAGAHSFTYNYLYPENATQQDVYDTCVAPLAKSNFEGYNCTILAYGQTGSGKTHTMGTSSCKGLAAHEWGIVPRVIQQLFDMIAADREKATCIVKVSFLECYNDDLFDLLRDDVPERASLQIKEKPSGGTEADGALWLPVNSAEETMEALNNGTQFRHTGSTNMNQTSSRSHAIFTLQLQKKNLVQDALGISNDTYVESKFHFVDLAGSERLKRTGAEGDRKKEGIAINKGLLAIGNVITALSEGRPFVPFRDSKITRLLQDSLGGNSKTLMIAAVSPADNNKEETLNTLQYANRAKQIKNKAIINRDANSVKMDKLRGHILMLEQGIRQWVERGDITQEKASALLQGAAMETGSRSASHSRRGSLTSSPLGGPSSSSSSSSAPLLPPLALGMQSVGPGQVVVDALEWMALSKRAETINAAAVERIEEQEREMVRLLNKNKQLRLDLNAKNEERLRALDRTDATRLLVESIASRFQDARAFLVEERERVERERAERRAARERKATTAVAEALAKVAVPGEPDLGSSAAAPAQDASAAAGAPAPTPSPFSPASSSAAPIVDDEFLDSLDEEGDIGANDLRFYSLVAPGGPAAPHNAQLGVLASLRRDAEKLTAKYREARAWKDRYRALEHEQEGRVRKLKRKLRQLQRRRDERSDGGLYNQGRAEEDEEEEDGGLVSDDDVDAGLDSGAESSVLAGTGTASPSTRSRNGGAGLSPSSSFTSFPSSALSPSGSDDAATGGAGGLNSASPDPPSILHADDLSDLEADEALAAQEEESREHLETLLAFSEQERRQQLSGLEEDERQVAARLSTAEKVMLQLAEKEARAARAVKEYSERVLQMTQDLNQANAKLAELESKHSASASGGGGSHRESSELREYRLKVEKLTRDLALQKSRAREAEEARRAHEQAQAREKKANQAEIEACKARYVAVQKAKDAIQARHRELLEKKELGMRQLEKKGREYASEKNKLRSERDKLAAQVKVLHSSLNIYKGKVREQDPATQQRKLMAARGAAGGGGSGPHGTRSARAGSVGASQPRSGRDAASRKAPLASSRTRKAAAAGLGGEAKLDGGTPVYTTLLSHGVHARVFHSDLLSAALAEHKHRVLRDVYHKWTLQRDAAQVKLESATKLLFGALDPSPEEYQRMEQSVSDREKELRQAMDVLASLQTRMDGIAANSGHRGTDTAAMDAWMKARFGPFLTELPVRLLAECVKAWGAWAETLNINPGWQRNELDEEGTNEQEAGQAAAAAAAAAGDEVDLGATYVSPRTSLATALSGIRASLGGGGGGGAAQRRDLQASPLEVQTHGSNYTTLSASPIQRSMVPDRPGALSSSPIHRSQGSDPSLPLSASMGDLTLGQGTGTTDDGAGEGGEGGEGGEVPEPQWHMQGPSPSYAQWQKQGAGANNGTQSNETSMAVPRTMHNNFTSNDGSGVAEGGDASASPPSSSAPPSSLHVLHHPFPASHVLTFPDSSSSSTASATAQDDRKPARSAAGIEFPRPQSARLAQAAHQASVFAKLTDPSNYTGSQKAKHDGMLQAARDQASAGRSGGAAAEKTSQSSSRRGGAGAPASHGLALSSSALASGRALAASASAVAESPCASPGGPRGRPEPAAAAAAAHVPPALPERVQDSRPIHERLADPRSFTGSQGKKFAEGVPSKVGRYVSVPLSQRAQESRESHTDRERERDRDRERDHDGFVLVKHDKGAGAGQHRISSSLDLEQGGFEQPQPTPSPDSADSASGGGRQSGAGGGGKRPSVTSGRRGAQAASSLPAQLSPLLESSTAAAAAGTSSAASPEDDSLSAHNLSSSSTGSASTDQENVAGATGVSEVAAAASKGSEGAPIRIDDITLA